MAKDGDPKRFPQASFTAFGSFQPMNPDEARFRDMIAKVQAKLERRKPDGFYAEYKGQFVFSDFEFLPTMPLRDAPRAMTSVFGGLIPWQADNFMNKVTDQKYNTRSQFNRALVACLDNPGTKESQQVFGILKDQINSFDVDAIIRHPGQHTREWWGKLDIMEEAYGMMQQKVIFDRKAFGITEMPPEMEAFGNAVERHTEKVKEVIEGLDKPELRTFLLIDDIVSALEGPSFTRPKTKFINKRRKKIPPELSEVMEDASSDAFLVKMQAFYDNVGNTCDGKWETIQEGWTWDEITTALDTFPSLRSPDTLVKTVDTISDALETDVEGVISSDRISATGVAKLIHFDIADNINPYAVLRKDIPNDDEIEGDTDVAFSDFYLPRKSVPSTSLQLFSVFGQQLPEEAFEAVLSGVQEAVSDKRNPTSQHEWLLLLTLLRDGADDNLKRRINHFVGREDFPHKAFQETFLDKREGDIYLMDDGKIRIATHDLARGDSLYTSSFVAPEEPVKPAQSDAKIVYQRPQPSKPQRSVQEQHVSTKRRNQPAQHVPSSDVQDASQGERSERPRPTIKLPEKKTYQDLAGKIAPEDLALVIAAIEEFQEHGRHTISPLRAITNEGYKLYKMRVNGKNSGIRVIMSSIGGNTLEIESINYRGKAYRKLLHY